MSAPLEVRELAKAYPGFVLESMSFTLEPGTITGFLGRNGAGKTTTLKCILGLARPDRGGAFCFGMDLAAREPECKQRIGYVAGGFTGYAPKRLAVVTDVVRRFYPRWDEGVYCRCLEQFELEEGKRVRELSAGMKVKYALALALSHHAQLLLLDEPTSGLDPVSREELLELFRALAREEGVTILFSTHITGDLDKCADHLLYLRRGRLVVRGPMETILSRCKDLETFMLNVERGERE